jgi:excisionase family DNA binding protein
MSGVPGISTGSPPSLLHEQKLYEPQPFTLDINLVNVHTVYMVAEIQTGYSTGQVAKALGVTKKTVLRWLANGELPEPDTLALGRISYRVWSKNDLDRAKEYRESHYRKKRS